MLQLRQLHVRQRAATARNKVLRANLLCLQYAESAGHLVSRFSVSAGLTGQRLEADGSYIQGHPFLISCSAGAELQKVLASREQPACDLQGDLGNPQSIATMVQAQNGCVADAAGWRQHVTA
jgi:hypothetical protein